MMCLSYNFQIFQETLQNIVQLMRFEVQPELVTQSKLKWAVSLCLTMPPVAPNVFPVGQAGIIGNKEKILIFLQLTRANVALQPGQDPLTVVVPVIYNISQNQTMLASLQKELNNASLHAVQAHLQVALELLKLFSQPLFFRTSTDRIQQQLRGGVQYILPSMTSSSTSPCPMKDPPSMDPQEARECQGDQS